MYIPHDFYNGYVFILMTRFVGHTRDDLSDWRYDGVIYPKTADPLNKEGKMFICLRCSSSPDGRYYLYYVLDKVSIVSTGL